MPPFVLSCLTYLCVALPGSTLGMLWPSMRISLHEPIGALGVVLVAGVAAGAVSSALTGRILSRVPAGTLLACGTGFIAGALAIEALAPALWLIVIGSAVFSVGFGAIDTTLNAYAAGHFGARRINWMHAAYGLGATFGPLLVTALLASGAGWRFALGSMAVALAACTLVLAGERHRWRASAGDPGAAADQAGRHAAAGGNAADQAGGHAVAGGNAADQAGARGAGVGRGAPSPEPPRRHRHRVLAAVVFTAVETGVESAAGIWGYIFLTSGRGLPATVAGVAVSAYWAMMFAGRVLLGQVAERAGASRVLAMAVAGVPAGAVLMAVPAPGFVAIAGMMVLGLAAAPVFPLLTLTTADRVGAGGATRIVGLQVAASAIGGAALPSAIGLAIGAAGARVLGPALLGLGAAMCAVYWLRLRPVRRWPSPLG